MPADKRVKGCPNENCIDHQNKVKQRVENDYCPKCGCKLVYVCSNCFSEIEDLGPEHRVCRACEAKAAEKAAHRREVLKQAGEKVGGAAFAVGSAIVTAVIATGKTELVSAAKKATKEVLDSVLKK